MVTYNTRMLETLMTVQRKITGLEHVHLDSLMYIDVYVGPWSYTTFASSWLLIG